VEGLEVFDEVAAGFSGDPTIMAIVDEGVTICNNQGYY
jgi:hypothetical protein